jgi:hypothetical protein
MMEPGSAQELATLEELGAKMPLDVLVIVITQGLLLA